MRTDTGMRMGTAMTTTATTDAAIMLRLLAWLSPNFPVGAFSYSHGIEAAVEEGTIRDGAGLRFWLEGVLAFGTARIDADLLREAWMAVEGDDHARFGRAHAWGRAMRGTPELALESMQQGGSFLDTAAACWPVPGLEDWRGRAAGGVAYPVAIGLVAALHAVPLRAVLLAYLHAFCANLVGAAVRLVPLGQTVGQRTLAELTPAIATAAAAAESRDFASIGAAAPMLDLLSIAHETQHTRLFRS